MITDVLVIGGSLAGLATGYHLKVQRGDFRIVDAAPAPGHAWRSPWDSLVLFTSRRYCALPGMAILGHPDAYPGKEDVADYLDAYAERFDLPLLLDTRVESLERDRHGFRAQTPHGPIAARAVVVATGPFQTARVPRISSEFSASVAQLHSSGYRNLGQLPDSRTMVVGGGNSRFQIALELARGGRDVHLAEGRRNVVLPQRILGRDLFWWLERTGVMGIAADCRLGARLRKRDPIIGTTRRMLRTAGVRLHPCLVEVDGDREPSPTTPASPTSQRSSGPPASPRTTPGSTSQVQSRTACSCSTTAARRYRTCTPSACPGSAPAGRRSSDGSAATRRRSRPTPPHPLPRTCRPPSQTTARSPLASSWNPRSDDHAVPRHSPA